MLSCITVDDIHATRVCILASMMIDVTVEEGGDVSTVQGLLDGMEAKP